MGLAGGDVDGGVEFVGGENGVGFVVLCIEDWGGVAGAAFWGLPNGFASVAVEAEAVFANIEEEFVAIKDGGTGKAPSWEAVAKVVDDVGFPDAFAGGGV